MKLSHDEIKEMLPDYAVGSLPSDVMDTVKVHLGECRDCWETVSLLTELREVEAPDPGDLYWETLPQRVRISSTQGRSLRSSMRSLFATFLPATAVMAILIVLVAMHFQRKETPRLDFLFKDPLASSTINYGDITEKDIPLVTESLPVDEVYPNIYRADYGYYTELASLSPDEANRLAEALERRHETGG
ncbi:MAG TPA: hypothetical protein VEE82_01700 [Thermodesulfovibrionales bacterium]|nr:hypothetical protein [Thermodesulfovibrionales bacterium]